MFDSKFAEKGLVLFHNFPPYEGRGLWMLVSAKIQPSCFDFAQKRTSMCFDFAQNLLSGCVCNKLGETIKDFVWSH
jgi:hypothetical protein